MDILNSTESKNINTPSPLEHIINVTMEKVNENVMRKVREKLKSHLSEFTEANMLPMTDSYNSKSYLVSSRSIDKNDTFLSQKRKNSSKTRNRMKERAKNVFKELSETLQENSESNEKKTSFERLMRNNALKQDRDSYQSKNLLNETVKKNMLSKRIENIRRKRTKVRAVSREQQARSISVRPLKSKLNMSNDVTLEQRVVQQPDEVEEKTENDDTLEQQDADSSPENRDVSPETLTKNGKSNEITLILSNERKLEQDNSKNKMKDTSLLPMKDSDEFDLRSVVVQKDSNDKPMSSIKFEKFTEKDYKSSQQMISNESNTKLDLSADYKDKARKILNREAETGEPEEHLNFSKVREDRIELEKGIFGLRVELRKVEEELRNKIYRQNAEFEQLKEEYEKFKETTNVRIIDTNQLQNNRYTEFKGHINSVLLEYKDSILIIQSYVDNQLVLNKRNQTDINIVIDNLLRKTEFHDKVSINFHRCTKSLKEIIFSLVEVLNINYDLIKQDEKDRESIALMGLTQNTHTIDYKKDSKIPPITLDKNCLSCSGRTTVILKAFKAACLSYSPSTVKYKGGTYTRDNLLGCIWEVITQLKSKLRDRNTLKSELPPID